MTGCYYDRQICNLNAVGGTAGYGEVQAEGKLTSEMTNGEVFDGWSAGAAGIWTFTDGLYPRLTGYQKTKPEPGYAVTISLPIPEDLLDKKELISVAHKSENGTVTTLASRLEQRNGV